MHVFLILVEVGKIIFLLLSFLTIIASNLVLVWHLSRHSTEGHADLLRVGLKLVLGPDFIRDATEKIDLIRHRMKEAQSRQKSYADNRRRNLEFSVEIWYSFVFHL